MRALTVTVASAPEAAAGDVGSFACAAGLGAALTLLVFGRFAGSLPLRICCQEEIPKQIPDETATDGW